ncbi:MAG: protein kinase [Verrucomicrobia bacterium]|nr:protein kinase [Verrucomicrobiota bacterium]
MSTTTPQSCPQCGAPLPASAKAGLCPRCVMAMNLATQTEFTGEEGPHGTKVLKTAPTPEELADKFPQLEILELLGRGGMGAVYRARQKELDRIVALKILPPGIGDDPGFAERFTREAKALAKLHHPNIVTLFEFGRADGLFFFLMEYVDGVNLRQLLQGSRISPHEALAIVPQICDALQFAHDQGIVHRDIKPENILMDRRGRVKVADFGLAKIVGAESSFGVPPSGGSGAAADRLKPELQALTDAGKVMGTPQYMAPEQRDKPLEVDHRADIYALGVVFYQMLTGELPGKQIEAPSKTVHIDVRLDEVVLRALENKPELRYQQASVFKTQVENIAASESASPPSEAPKRSQPNEKLVNEARSRLKAPAIGLTIYGASSLLLIVIGLVQVISQPPQSARIISMLSLLGSFFGVFVIVCAQRMLRLRNYRLAVTASILALLPFMYFPPIILFGIVFGIWSLIVLSKKEVREAFEAKQKRAENAKLSTPKTPLQYIALGWFFTGIIGTILWMQLTGWRYATPLIPGSLALVLALLCGLKKRFAYATLLALFSFGVIAILVMESSHRHKEGATMEIQERLKEMRSVNSPSLVESTAASFGPVIELVVESGIDFDTGTRRHLPLPHPVGDRDQARYDWFNGNEAGPWMREHGIDAVNGNHALMSKDLMLVKLEKEDWDTLSPDKLHQRIAAQAPATDSFEGNRIHMTFGFKTREGGIGIVQMMEDRYAPGTVNKLPGVKIRYKLVRDNLAESGLAPKTDFAAQLPDGSFVELVCLMHGSNPRRASGQTNEIEWFWNPDGTPSEENIGWSFGASTLSSTRDPSLDYRKFVARWGGPNANNAHLMGWQLDENPPDSADGQFTVTPKGESAENWIGLVQGFPQDKKTATIRFALASGPYLDGPKPNFGWSSSDKTPYGSFSIGQIFDHNGNAAVTLTHNLKGCDYRLRTHIPEPSEPKSTLGGFIWEWKQEFRRGKQFQPVYGRIVKGGAFSQTFEFPGIPAKEAMATLPRIDFEVRPVQWVEFQNVALNPGEQTRAHIRVNDAAAPATDVVTFGPVMDRVLPDPDNGTGKSNRETLNLRTGEQTSILDGAPKESGGRLGALVASEGDLIAEYDDFVSGRWAFVTAGLKLSDFLTRQWETATPEDVGKALKQPSALQRVEHSGATIYYLPDGLLPLTFAFESRTGERGLLQIPGFTDNPRTVTIRYKLVQTAGSTSVNPGDFKLTLTNGVSFEVVAICRNPRGTNLWWKPDGTRFPTPPFEIMQLPELEPTRGPTVTINPTNEFLIYVQRQWPEDWPKDVARAVGMDWSPRPSDIGFFPPTIRDLESGKKASAHLICFDQVPGSVNYLVKVARGPWEAIAVYDGKQTRELVNGVMVVCSTPAIPEKRDDHQFEVMHNVDREVYSMRLIAKFLNGKTSEVDFHPGPVRGNPSKGSAIIHPGDFNPADVMEYVIERARWERGEIKGISLKANVGHLQRLIESYLDKSGQNVPAPHTLQSSTLDLTASQRIAIVEEAHRAFRRLADTPQNQRLNDDISEKFWGETIRSLKPVRVVNDRVNIKIVLHESGGIESGFYVNLPVSSYAPQTEEFLEFVPLSQPDDKTFGEVYRYKLNTTPKITVFSPVVERTLQSPSTARTNAFIDFDTAKVLTPPATLDVQEPWKADVYSNIWNWAASNGVDAVADTSQEVRGLRWFGVSVTRVPDSEWVNGTAQSIEIAVNSREAQSAFHNIKFPSPADDRLQAVISANTLSTDSSGSRTYAFRTREGNPGLLQFRSYTDAPGGSVTIRYKLVRSTAP